MTNSAQHYGTLAALWRSSCSAIFVSRQLPWAAIGRYHNLSLS